jgi:hypothetical protein
VPRAELACCRVRDDGGVTAAQPSRAVLRLLSGPAARVVRQLVCFHGAGNRSPMRCGEDVCVLGTYRVSWPTPQSETETARVNKWLVVRGGNCSEGVPLVENWSEMLPTSREHEVLPVMVLTGVLCDKTAQNIFVLSPKPVHVAIKLINNYSVA